MPPPCGHLTPDLPPEGAGYDSAHCRLCWLYHTDPAYRRLWGEPAPAQHHRLTQACVHRGGVQRKETCSSCRGRVHLKVFDCSVHGACTVGKALPGLACCAFCSDYDPGPAGEVPSNPTSE